jgi:hypothetical protein
MPSDRQLPLPHDYEQLLGSLKTRIRAAQVRAALAVNSELVTLYWSIGQEISSRFQVEKWGGDALGMLPRPETHNCIPITDYPDGTKSTVHR